MQDVQVRIPKSAIHTFVACSARRWGLRSRVTIVNHTGERIALFVCVRTQDGVALTGSEECGSVEDGKSVVLGLDELAERLQVSSATEERLFVFSLVPMSWIGRDDPVTIDLSEVMRVVMAQDHYIEHYDPETGFSSGVCYQTPPLNDAAFTPHYSLLMQAPKVFLSERRNTIWQVLHYSSDPSYREARTLRCAMRRPDGALIHSWLVDVPAHGMRYVDVKATLREAGIDWRDVVDASGFLFFEAFSPSGTFIPLTMNFNEREKLWDMEHSLPPNYYASEFGGELKKQILARLLQDRFASPDGGR